MHDVRKNLCVNTLYAWNKLNFKGGNLRSEFQTDSLEMRQVDVDRWSAKNQKALEDKSIFLQIKSRLFDSQMPMN